MLDKFKIYIKNILKLVVMNLARILFLFPVHKRRIFFSSYMGENITGNPKCIYDYLRTHYHDKLEYIWTYNGSPQDTDFDGEVKIVKEFSLKWFYYRATSHVVVDNCNPTFIVPRRSQQLIIQTWHAGGAYKKVGGAASNIRFEKWVLYTTMSVSNLFVSSSEEFTKKNIKEGYHYRGEVIDSGMPRNDIFFDSQKVEKSTQKIKEYYKINGLIALYAPTFRGNIHNTDKIENPIDIDKIQKALRARYGEEVNVLVRSHHWDKSDYCFSSNVIDATKYPDMQELLCASDILITDYSSCMWDFALLKRPCFLYVPDIDEYIKNRGLFIDVESWPGFICKDVDKLCEVIKNYNENECVVKAENHLQIMNSYETGHATQKVSKKIIDHIKKS